MPTKSKSQTKPKTKAAAKGATKSAAESNQQPPVSDDRWVTYRGQPRTLVLKLLLAGFTAWVIFLITMIRS